MLAGLALGFALAAVPAAARADSDLPAGSLGFVGGFRDGQGRLGDAYTIGPIWGVQAGYHPMGLAQKWSVGGAWSVLWGRLWADDPEITDGTLHVLEMNLAIRVRRLVSERDPVYLMLSPIGVTILRTNLPIPPDGERQYIGPYAGMGGEMFLNETFSLSAEARYGVFTGGPRSLTFLFCLAVGSG